MLESLSNCLRNLCCIKKNLQPWKVEQMAQEILEDAGRVKISPPFKKKAIKILNDAIRKALKSEGIENLSIQERAQIFHALHKGLIENNLILLHSVEDVPICLGGPEEGVVIITTPLIAEAKVTYCEFLHEDAITRLEYVIRKYLPERFSALQQPYVSQENKCSLGI